MTEQYFMGLTALRLVLFPHGTHWLMRERLEYLNSGLVENVVEGSSCAHGSVRYDGIEEYQ